MRPRSGFATGLAFASTILLLGCGGRMLTLETAPTPISTERILEPGKGFVVIELELSHDVPWLLFSPSSDTGQPFQLRDLDEGFHLFVVAVPAGDYHLRRVDIMGYRYRNEMRPYEATLERNRFRRFSVRAGEVNYPGRFVITRRKSSLATFTANRSGALVERLRGEGEWLLLRYPASYTGRRRDNFLHYYSERLKSARQAEAEASLEGGDAAP